MNAVYSGGLVYEYSQEDSNYGLVDIKDGKVSERPDFGTLKSAFAKTPIPSGDGGYKSSGSASQCPTKSSTWNVTMSADQLPAYPSDAKELLQKGAGTGPGLQGGGSQDAGSATPSYAGAADGAVTTGGTTAGSATPSKGAAVSFRPNFSMAPFACGAVIFIGSLLGGALVL
jgi:hypothetical protein